MTLADSVAAGGGEGLRAAASLSPDGVIAVVEDSGLRGRGGAGFPTARKWQTVRANEVPDAPASVVVNAAEGEPGSFKDRAILRADPYRVLEGALIAARAVGADSVTVATKHTFTAEIQRLRQAIGDVREAGWADDVTIDLVEGPSEYLFGEETALLEVIDGRYPLPRIAPPYRRGIVEVAEHPDHPHHESDSAAGVTLASATHETDAPPTLAGNVETFANIPAILAQGARWFREVGTDLSPGTIVCTVTGATRRHGVGEFPLGTPVRAVIEALGGGPREGREIVAVMSGVANPLLPATLLDTPASYEALSAAGSGLGAAGFIVYDDADDLVAVAAGVSRFLAVESCGQCARCKQDGLALAELLASVAASQASERDLATINTRLATVADGARCNLASQQQAVIGSIMSLFPDSLRAHLHHDSPGVAPEPIAMIVDIVDGHAELDVTQTTKQPDWTHDAVDSGQWPADRLDDPRRHEQL